MKTERFYLSCLAHASYIVYDEASREAAVIDPQRDIDRYVSFLDENRLSLKYILETHLHADFVSGHGELAEITGAEIVFSHLAGAQMPHRPVKESDQLSLGSGLTLTVLETPGHTPESVCYHATDSHEDHPGILFSGDTVFAGDVGRPDLLGTTISAEELAGRMYTTIHNKLKLLPDDLKIFPAHGAGSSCGRALGDEEFTSIGKEKARNYAFQITDREQFIKALTADQPPAPPYFKQDARINRTGAPGVQRTLEKLQALNAREFQEALQAGALVLDTRPADDYANGSVPGAINIGLGGQFASWVGTLIPFDTNIILIAEEEAVAESALRCARIGFDRVSGYLKGGPSAWERAGFSPLVKHERPGPQSFASVSKQKEFAPQIVDVRKPAERASGYIPNSTFIPLNELDAKLQKLEKSRPTIIYCAGGYRSSMAVGLLRNSGFSNVSDLRGGMSAYQNMNLPVARDASA